ncbi:hypothetical protein FXO38_19182 [Capsicum annuum]|nr:hypothetical protein FXO38_19182 [Capsicum annuum]KAF3649097.1 hypothetical protein FXO37_19117 [Capsicum annuum]
MTDEYRQYNALKKLSDKKCDIALDYLIRREYFKNILKSFFKAYLDWNDGMDIPNVPDLDSDSNAILIRNPREVRSREWPQINRNRSFHQNTFRGETRRWGFRKNTMMYIMRDKASKVGVAVADGVVEEVEEAVYMVVEEVEVMMQM